MRYEEDEKTMGSTAGSRSAVIAVTAPLAGSEMKLREVEPSRSCPRVIYILSLLTRIARLGIYPRIGQAGLELRCDGAHVGVRRTPAADLIAHNRCRIRPSCTI